MILRSDRCALCYTRFILALWLLVIILTGHGPCMAHDDAEACSAPGQRVDLLQRRRLQTVTYDYDDSDLAATDVGDQPEYMFMWVASAASLACFPRTVMPPYLSSLLGVGLAQAVRTQFHACFRRQLLH